MSKNQRNNFELIDPDTVTELSDARKKHMLEQGYRPYRTDQNKIKWLNNDQLAYKMVKTHHSFVMPGVSKRIHPKKSYKRRKHHSHRIRRFWRKILFYILLIFILIALFYLFKHNFFII